MNLKNFFFLVCGLFFFNLAFADQDITLVNHEYEGTKQWLPGSIFAYVGEKINITLINNVPSGIHGFSIPEFDQKTDVKKGEKKTLSFVATKAGIFPMKCHLHPAHVGGQLVILDKPIEAKK
ncbi:MAG: cupredoxin domain-containing protein [Bacteriovoracaceae bacterium]|nr:cupredoxin domain-containing protein [Bacteriovoracaceae bacterium]